MQFLCHHISPELYAWVLKCVPLLGAIQLSFERLGPERVEAWAARLRAASLRVRTWSLPSQTLGLFSGYAHWAGWLAAYVLSHPPLNLTPPRTRTKLVFKGGADAGSLPRTPLVPPAPGGPAYTPGFASMPRYPTIVTEEENPLIKAPDYSARTHLLLAALTLLVIALAAILVGPHIPYAPDIRTAAAAPAGGHWYARLYAGVQSLYTYALATVLLLGSLALVAYLTGWVLHLLLSAALRAAGVALGWTAAILSSTHRRDLIFIAGVFQLVVPLVLPEKLTCAP